MKKLLLLLFITSCDVAYPQAASWAETILKPTTTINNSSAEGLGAFSTSTGVSIQVDLTCLGTCMVQIKIFSSVNGTGYQEITDLTRTLTATTTVVFNLHSQHFKYFKVTATELSSNDASVKITQGTKSQL